MNKAEMDALHERVMRARVAHLRGDVIVALDRALYDSDRAVEEAWATVDRLRGEVARLQAELADARAKLAGLEKHEMRP